MTDCLKCKYFILCNLDKQIFYKNTGYECHEYKDGEKEDEEKENDETE